MEVHAAGHEGPGEGVAQGLISGDCADYRARITPHKTACIDLASGEAVDYAGLDVRVGRAAGWLAGLGLEAGDPMAFLGRNSLDAVALAIACERIGAVFAPLNWRLTPAELAPVLADAGPALLLADGEFETTAQQAAAEEGLPVVSLQPGLDELTRDCEPVAGRPGRPGRPDEPLALLYSSGTTGRPKGVVITRRNALFSALNFAFVGAVGPETVALLDLPIFHTIGLVAVTRTTLTMGGTLIISDRFIPDRTLAALSDPSFGVSHYFCVPQMAAMLRDHPQFDAGRLSGLKAIFVGGSPVSAQLIQAWLAAGVPLVNGFGMTEAGTVMHMPLDREAVRANPGSIGLPAPFLEIRLVDAAGNDVPEGTPGELWLRGPSVTHGYWTASAGDGPFADGWYRTGDVLRREPNGFYTLIDRLKDIYISGGENVYPGEVEAVLAGHPAVREVAVFGVPDERWGESGIAHVVLVEGAGIDLQTLLAHCEARLARFKRPQRIVLVETIPRTASGKALKYLLREAHAAAANADPDSSRSS